MNPAVDALLDAYRACADQTRAALVATAAGDAGAVAVHLAAAKVAHARRTRLFDETFGPMTPDRWQAWAVEERRATARVGGTDRPVVGLSDVENHDLQTARQFAIVTLTLRAFAPSRVAA